MLVVSQARVALIVDIPFARRLGRSVGQSDRSREGHDQLLHFPESLRLSPALQHPSLLL